MSRGFVKESDQEEAPFVTPRAALPPGATNYVTARGLALLHAEREALEAQRAAIVDPSSGEGRRDMGVLAAKLIQLNDRIASARLVAPADVINGEVRFGAEVTYLRLSAKPAKSLTVTIVGVDEANVKERRVSYLSPLASALTGKRVGDIATLTLGRGVERLEVTAIHYPEDEEVSPF